MPFDSVEFEEGNAVKWSAMASSLPTALSSQGYDSLLLADTPLAPTAAAERPSIADITPLGGPSKEEFIDNNWIDAMLVAVESALQNFEQDDCGGDNDDAPPAPFNSAEFEEGNTEKRVAALRARVQIAINDDDDEAPLTPSAGIIVPPRDEIKMNQFRFHQAIF